MDKQYEQIKKILAGDRKAFNDLIREYQNLVMHIVSRLITNKSEQEEMCQDIFVRVYQNLHRFEHRSRLATWIGRITYNACMNYLRKIKTVSASDLQEFENMESEDFLHRVPDPDDSPEETVNRQNQREIIQKMLNRLPDQFRLLLSLYHMEQLNYSEIAEITGLPDGTVKSYIFRARKLLKEKLIDTYHGEHVWT